MITSFLTSHRISHIVFSSYGICWYERPTEIRLVFPFKEGKARFDQSQFVSYRDQSLSFQHSDVTANGWKRGCVRDREEESEAESWAAWWSGAKGKIGRVVLRDLQEFPEFIWRTGSRLSYLRFPLGFRVSLGPMARRNADCRCRCMVSRGAGYAPRRAYIYAWEYVVVGGGKLRGMDKSRWKETANFASEISLRLCVRSLSSGNDVRL